MTVEAAIFRCSICGEPSSDICVACTKDACGNHRCERCKRCSDCCECEVPLSAAEAQAKPEAVPQDRTVEPSGAIEDLDLATLPESETESGDLNPPNDPLL